MIFQDHHPIHPLPRDWEGPSQGGLVVAFGDSQSEAANDPRKRLIAPLKISRVKFQHHPSEGFDLTTILGFFYILWDLILGFICFLLGCFCGLKMNLHFRNCRLRVERFKQNEMSKFKIFSI